MVSTMTMARTARALALAATAALLLSGTAPAQRAGMDDASPPVQGGLAPQSEGNIYHHRDHQPTQSQESAAGIPPPSAATHRQVEEEVNQLLRQTDRLNRQSEQQEQDLVGSSVPCTC